MNSSALADVPGRAMDRLAIAPMAMRCIICFMEILPWIEATRLSCAPYRMTSKSWAKC
jgi:hypothetical protein